MSNLQAAKEAIDRHGFWFVDVPRTGSSSLRAELGRLYGPPYVKGNIADPGFHGPFGAIDDHVPAREMIDILGRERWDSLFTFSFVRNPWDRMFSLYQYRRKIALDIPLDTPFRQYVFELQKQKRLPQEKRTWYRGYFYSACDYLTDGNGTLLVKFVGRHEARAGGLSYLNTRIPVPVSGSLHLMETSRTPQDYQASYDDETRAIIADLYADDVRLFGYAFDDVAPASAEGAHETDRRRAERAEAQMTELLQVVRQLHEARIVERVAALDARIAALDAHLAKLRR